MTKCLDELLHFLLGNTLTMLILHTDYFSITTLVSILDWNLNLKHHISFTKKKLYPIIQNFPKNCILISEYIASIWYKCLVRPIVEYGAPILFSSYKYKTAELLKIKKRCLKIISQNHKSVTRFKFDIPAVKFHIRYLHLLAFYKFAHKLIPAVDQDLVPTSLAGGVIRLATSTVAGMDGTGIKTFYGLPSDIRALPTLSSFKKSLKRHLLCIDIYDEVISYLSSFPLRFCVILFCWNGKHVTNFSDSKHCSTTCMLKS